VIQRFLDHLGAAACLAGLSGRNVLAQPRHRLVGMIERQRVLDMRPPSRTFSTR
jgi:hypothetical protein